MGVEVNCTICLEDSEGIAFKCMSHECSYQICPTCIKVAFEDCSGENSKACPMCNAPTAMKMVEAMCGKGAVRAIENELRSSVEFDMRKELLKKQEATKELVGTNAKARQLFNELAELVLMKCPRCKTAFYDYEGCNALSCSMSDCKAAFCAICLKDCGNDAHGHVRGSHGDLFDKKAFEESRVGRTQAIVSKFMNELTEESFELRQLVQNHVDQAKLIPSSTNVRADNYLVQRFVEQSRSNLMQVAKSDRLSILSEQNRYGQFQRGLQVEDISPRCAVPEEYRLWLHVMGSTRIKLEELTINNEWKEISLEKFQSNSNSNSNRRTVDCLVNIKQSLQCAVIAVCGERHLYQTRRVSSNKKEKLADNELSIELNIIKKDGEIDQNAVQIHENMQIIGMNQNLRMMLLQRHLEENSVDTLVSTPLRHLIGAEKPKPVFTEILRPLPDTMSILNEAQRRVAHPLLVKTAMEVAGPPGTGKTKTITELVRSLLECSDHNIIVLSERNGAINAIAEKFADSCLELRNGNVSGVSNVLMWTSVMTFGAAEGIGASTKLFTLDEKLKHHPDLVPLKNRVEEANNASNSLKKDMCEQIADEIAEFGDACFERKGAYLRSRIISEGKDAELSGPNDIVYLLIETEKEIGDILSDARNIKEEQVEDLVVNRSVLMGKLITIRDKKEKGNWNKFQAVGRLRDLRSRFSKLSKLPLFDADNATTIKATLRRAHEEFRTTQEKLRNELGQFARLKMSTIGSSHKLPVVVRKPNVDEITNGFGQMDLNNEQSQEDDGETGTIVIFDEAGCIPPYELLGLSRLGCNISGIVLVGDKHQLPPYNTMQEQRNLPYRRMNSRSMGLIRRVPQAMESESTQQKSLLDVSNIPIEIKVKLTTQYRVPKDIADLLNDRVYSGDYNTSPHCKAPYKGLQMIDVPADKNPRKKYVNSNEVENVIRIIREMKYDICYEENIMILTPYKNQQRELQYQLKKSNLERHTVLTIDQCQGQESDIVIISLVQKPTRFLTKNRLNVALSRVRKKLYVLTDKRELRDAASNTSWEASLMAHDLLCM